MVKRKLMWILSTIILVCGIITFDFEAWKWGVLGISIFSLPLLFQIIKSTDIKIWALWFGIFLVLQSIISPLFIDSDFVMLKPNLHEVIDVKGGIPGIIGIQRFTTDSKGFRTTKNIDYSSNLSYRIFAIGGSTTEDAYNDRRTWTHILQEQLSSKAQYNVEVVNTGVNGLRAKNHLATLRKIMRMNPDLVIFLIGFNDWNYHITDNFSGNREPYIGIFPDYIDSIRLRNTMLGKAISRAYNSTKQTRKVSEPRIIEDYGEYFTNQRNSLNRPIPYSFHPGDVHPDYRKQLLKISAICDKYNIKCLFITQPTGYQYGASEEFKKGFWMTPPDQPYTLDFESLVKIAALYNSFLIKFAAENNHDICDAASKIEPSYDNFFDDCHFNTEGARKFGMIVSNCVEKYVK